jgi:hypothetical protein
MCPGCFSSGQHNPSVVLVARRFYPQELWSTAGHLFPNTNILPVIYSNRHCIGIRKGTSMSVPVWATPWGSRILRLPEFLDNQHMREARLSALSTGRLYPEKTSHSCKRLSPSQGHIATGIFKLFISLINLTDLIGNWTRDLLACSAVSQPAAQLPPPLLKWKRNLIPGECNLLLGCSYRDRGRVYSNLQMGLTCPL